MKITKAVRERAAWLCAVAASHRAGDPGLPGLDPDNIEADAPAGGARVTTPAAKLATQAFMRVPMDAPFEEQWAEAESWLRTGWTP